MMRAGGIQTLEKRCDLGKLLYLSQEQFIFRAVAAHHHHHVTRLWGPDSGS